MQSVYCGLTSMKIAVSNIAWDNRYLAEHLALLKDLGCDGVELAPSCIWPEPVFATAADRIALRDTIKRSGLELVGFHALLFTRPDLQLFADRSSCSLTIDYLARLAELCADLDGGLLVLGSPRNRVLHGRRYDECMKWATDAFRTLAEACAPRGAIFCIEPLGPDETEFIKSAREGAELVERVSHPNFRLHLDAKALIGTGENLEHALADYGELLRHFHVGDPGLAPPGATGADHAPFGKALRRYGYRGYVSIEMRRGHRDSRDAVRESVDYVRRNYIGAEPLAAGADG